jgi:hypothetical protein
MLTANELRIGNLVCYHGDEDLPCLLDATDIKNIADKYMNNDEIHSPIPITEEILLKCGFELNYGGQLPDYIQRGGFVLFWYEEKLSANFGYMADLSVEIQYLHELQNLYFALTGTELIVSPLI